jgi:hypothetical protein
VIRAAAFVSTESRREDKRVDTMKKYGILLSFCFLTLTAGAAGKRALVPLPLPSISPSPLVPGAGLTLEPVEYYTTPQERVKIEAAGSLAASVIHSDCFKNFMAGRALIQTNSRTPAQVVSHLQGLAGTVPVQMYYRPMWLTSAVAYRQPPDFTIHLNRAVFTPNLSTCLWAATIAHESYGHSAGGYDHDFNWSPSRSFSVPYSMGGADKVQGGDAFARCCKP